MESKSYILILLTLILTSCGGSHDGEIPLPDSVSGSGSSSGGGDVSSGSGTNSSTGSSSGVRSGESYLTSSGGKIIAFKSQNISLASNEFLTGATTANGFVFYATYSSLTYPNEYWKIYKLTPSTGAVSLHCSWIENGNLWRGMASDDTYLYIYEGTYRQSIRKIQISNCGYQTSITSPLTMLYQSQPTFAVDAGWLYYPARTNTSYSYPYTYGLIQVTTSNQNLSTAVNEIGLGSSSTNWGSTYAVAARQGSKWGVFSPDYSHYSIWRFNSQVPANVATLPNKVMNIYLYPFSASFLDDNTLVLFSSSYDPKIIYFDVSGF